MRERITIGFAVFVLVIFIPYIGTLILSGVPAEQAKVLSVSELDSGKTISIQTGGVYQVLDIEEYLKGVLPGMTEPVSDIEVWKTLAVVARTNLYREMGGLTQIDESDVEEDYLTETEIRTLWGYRNYEQIMPLVEQAIIETQGEAMTYDGEYIEAYYHRVSSGETVSAEELLGRTVPYLVSVDSGFDVEAKDYMNLIMIDQEEVQELSILEATEHGYVKSISWNGESISAVDFCQKYRIPSYFFYIEDMRQQMNAYRIVALGYGHGLGLSIYGAERMSKMGKGYQEILKYYYPGIAV